MEDHKTKVGLIAGWGRYPIVVAEAIRRQGHEVCGVGLRDHVDPEFATACDTYHTCAVAHLGSIIRFFRRQGVQRAAMAGKVYKVRLIGRWSWIKFTPDWTTLKAFYRHFITSTRDRKDDTLLLTVVETMRRRGVTIVPPTEFAPELLVKQGQLCGKGLSAAQWKDVELGWETAKELGRLDVGQSVAVKGRVVIAVEAIEGTDQCILRAGQLCSSGGFAIVKVSKPQQDMRFDVPTIGMQTMQMMAKSGASILAIEAEKTILVDQSEVLEFARRHNITIVSISEQKLSVRLRAA